MLITFLNGNDVAYGTQADIGVENNIVLGLLIDPQGSTASISGNILKNNTKIGEFTWNSTEGQNVIWYTGEGRPIYVLNNDVIRAVTLTPSSTETQLTIKRVSPALDGVLGLAKINTLIKPMVPTAKPKGRIRAAIDYISGFTGLKYSKRTPINVMNLKAYIKNAALLPEQPVYVYGNAAELNNALATLVPPSNRDIFEKWDRISANDYFTPANPPPAENEAAAWVWNDTRQAAVMPLNSSTFLGFISSEAVDYYDHEVTVSSGNADDDWNGLIMAFVRQGNINYHLSFLALVDGTNGAANPPADNLNIRYNFSTSIKSNGGNNLNGGWAGKTKRMKVSRRGDQFTMYASNWNSNVFNPALTMTLNLNDDPRFAIFKGPTKYGYGNISQADSYFDKIKYFGGILRDTIVDAQNNRVYRYTPGSGWQQLAGVKAQDVFGAPRVITNPDDNKRYRLELNNTITPL